MVQLLYLAGIASFALSATAAVAHPVSSRHNILTKRKKFTPNRTACGEDCNLNNSPDPHVASRAGKHLGVEALFPQKGFLEGWTVSGKSHPQAQTVHLADDTFIVEKDIKNLKHPVVEVDGKRAIHAHHVKGACWAEAALFGIGGLA